MRKLLTFCCLALYGVLTAAAQKQVYIPDEWRHPWKADSLLYAENDPDNRYTWSRTRSVESDNVIVFWDKNYGSALPSQSPEPYRVDEQDLLRKCEAFFDLEINTLGFVDPQTSNLAKYKIMVLLNHTTSWICNGAGYDYEVSALWLSPSTCKPVGHSVAHEVGHSFHYMCYAEACGHNHTSSATIGTGFHLALGKGQGIWEQTAQWQANQSYPSEMFPQSIGYFRNSHNLAFTHEWHRYQSYWFLYYLCQHYDDITTVAQVWNQPMTGARDFNEALMKLKGLSVRQLFALYYDYAARLATWDLEACRPYRDAHIGDFGYQCVPVGDSTYQVALASAPQATGFNLIPLRVPEAGTLVTTHFTALPVGSALAAGDPAQVLNGDAAWVQSGMTRYASGMIGSFRGFRLGYVALLNDGTRRYFQQDSVYCLKSREVTEQVSFTVPQGTSRLWLVVVPAPVSYKQHLWDDDMSTDDQWPYRFRVEGTTLGSHAVVHEQPQIDGRPVADVTFTYDVRLPVRSNYEAVPVTLSGSGLARLGTAFQMNGTAVAPLMQSWSASGPSSGRVMFYALTPGTQALASQGSTANGYGHWFSRQGSVTSYSSGYVYSEFNPASLTFTIGQYPGRVKAGDTFTIGQALRYRTATGTEAVARFLFRVVLTSGEQGAELSQIDYENPAQTAVFSPSAPSPRASQGVFRLDGRRASSAHGRGIVVKGGKKLIAR